MAQTTWANKTLSTDETIRKIEKEIMQMQSGDDGAGTLTAAAVSTVTFSDATDLAKLMVGSALVVSGDHYYIVSKTDTTNAVIDKVVTWDSVSFKYKTWTNKIEDAKNLLGARIINNLKKTEYACYVSDTSDINTILDIVAQTNMLNSASDRLTLKFIYSDLKQSNEDNYAWKMLSYEEDFKQFYQAFIDTIKLDLDRDGETDTFDAGITTVRYYTR